MTQPRKPWEPEEYRPNPPFSSLPHHMQEAMKARLADTLASLKAAKPENERLQRQPASEASRKAERAST